MNSGGAVPVTGEGGEPVTVLCPSCLHDGVLERTLARAEAAEAALEAERERTSRLEAVSGEVIALFTVEGRRGAARRRTRWVPMETIGRWIEVVYPRQGYHDEARDPVPGVMRGLRERYGVPGGGEEAARDA